LTGSRQSLRAVPPESFGSRLRRKRRTDDLTQAELGERFGVRQQTIGAWERGERPQNRFLGELADYLGFEGEQELVALLDNEAELPQDVFGAAGDKLPATDGETVRMIAWRFVRDQEEGSLSPAQAADIYRSLLEYFQTRAADT
jgi:transcriptional regulator with XRE-family HTH domain